MNFYTTQHEHYCGVDLHARTTYICILSQQGVFLLHRNLPCDAEKFLLAIIPSARTSSSRSSASTVGAGS